MIKTIKPHSGPGFVVVKRLALDRFQEQPRLWYVIASPRWLRADAMPQLDGSIQDLVTALGPLTFEADTKWADLDAATWFAHELDAVAFALIIDGQIVQVDQFYQAERVGDEGGA